MKLYRILLWKAYFDRGLGLTSYVKYLLAFVGIFQLINARTGMVLVGLYIVGCFILGWAWFKYKLVETENEIQNQFNPFQQEVRQKLSGAIIEKV